MDGNKWRPETDAELAARLVTKRDERIKELESRISEPVQSFGTPELVAWAEKLQHILADFPEEERGELPFIFTMGNHLEKFAKSWNSPAMRQLQDENAGIRAALEPFARFAGTLVGEADSYVVARRPCAEYAGLIQHDPDGMVPLFAAHFRKARAALGENAPQSDYVAIPSDTLDWIFRSLCAYLDYFGVDSRCYDPKEAVETIRPYTSLGNPSETPISSGDENESDV